MTFNPFINPAVTNFQAPTLGSLYQPQTPTPYYNPFQGIQGESPYKAQAPEAVEPEAAAQQVVAEAIREVPQNNDREEHARMVHAKAVQKARDKWGPNAPPLRIPGLIGAAIELLGLNKPKEGWVEGNDLTEGYYERSPGLPGSPLPGVGIAELRDARNVLGVTPTGRPGTGHGDFSVTTGGVFNQYGVAVDPETGDAMQTANGTAAYASFDDWKRVMAAGSATGWRGGILTASQRNSLSPTGQANYAKFRDELRRVGGLEREENITPAEVREISRAQDPRQEHQYGGGSNDYGNRQGSGTGGQARSGEFVSSSHDWSAANEGGLIAMNYGGEVMNPLVSYRQVGGAIADDGSNVPQPVIEDQMPVEAPVAPPQAPMAPPAPAGPPPRMSFAEKVAMAREAIKSGQTAVPTEMPVGVMDGQGDGPVIDPAGVFEPAPVEIAPDVGMDDVDGHLPENSFVMNEEGTEMFNEDIQTLCKGGYVDG